MLRSSYAAGRPSRPASHSRAMFGSLLTLLAFPGLAMLSAGGIAYALLQDRVQSEKRTTDRSCRWLVPALSKYAPTSDGP
jgi:hypothetical protein